MPYTLNLLVFPFSLSPDLKKTDCKSFKIILEKVRKNLHIMDLVEINGPDTHEVFKFLKGKVGIEEMKEDRTTFFFVNPVATRIDIMEGVGFSTLKKHIKDHLMGWEEDL